MSRSTSITVGLAVIVANVISSRPVPKSAMLARPATSSPRFRAPAQLVQRSVMAVHRSTETRPPPRDPLEGFRASAPRRRPLAPRWPSTMAVPAATTAAIHEKPTGS
jgi:hypothetical protein